MEKEPQPKLILGMLRGKINMLENLNLNMFYLGWSFGHRFLSLAAAQHVPNGFRTAAKHMLSQVPEF